MERRGPQQRTTVSENATILSSFDAGTTKGLGPEEPEHHDLTPSHVVHQVAADTQREAGPKIKQAVAAVHPKNEDKDEVAAFQKRKGNKNTEHKKSSNTATKSGSKGYSNNYRSNTGPGNNANRNGNYCVYCKLQNHTQEECF